MIINKQQIIGDKIEMKHFMLNKNILDQFIEDKNGLHLMNFGIVMKKYHLELIVHVMVILENLKHGYNLK